MKLKLVIFLVLIAAATLLFTVSVARAQEIEYPVEELGDCESEAECRTYCDKPAHMEACIAFAKEYKLMSEEEIRMAENFLEAGGEGPGGCDSQESCESYCNDISHMDECIAYAEEHGIIPPEELEEAKKVQAALKGGAQLPGGCQNKKACDVYCSVAEHMEECIAFGEAAGFIPEEELAEAKLMLEAIKKGAKPPACQGKKACDAYCAEESHFQECMAFAEAAGFISPEEAEMARKTGGKGPGGCRGRDECEEFCQQPENQETCFNFGKEHGMISEEDLAEMEEGKERMMEAFSEAPEEVMECLDAKFGSEMIEKLKSGSTMPTREIGDGMKECFEQQMRPPEGMMPPGEGEGEWGGGPGGCQSEEECERPVIFDQEGEEQFEERRYESPERMMPSREGEMMPRREEAPGPVPPGASEEQRQEALNRAMEMVRTSLERLTPEMKECVISEIGQAVYDKLYAGDFTGFTVEDSNRIPNVTYNCSIKFRPMPPAETQPQSFKPRKQQFSAPEVFRMFGSAISSFYWSE